jgi:hypothetical protein
MKHTGMPNAFTLITVKLVTFRRIGAYHLAITPEIKKD